MTHSDTICTQHLADAKATGTNLNIITGLATLGAGGAGAVVAGVVTKSALAAASSFSAGTRSLINEEAYRNAYVETIISVIKKSRDDTVNNITNKRAKSLTEYTVEDAIRDAVIYNDQCSFYWGVTKVAEDAAQRPSRADLKSQLDDIKTHIQETNTAIGTATDPSIKNLLQKQLSDLTIQQTNLQTRFNNTQLTK